jgi:reactive intermediate/imine deaminase
MSSATVSITVVLVTVLASRAANADPQPRVEYLPGPDAATLNLPFSEAVRVGHTLYLSGEIGRIPGTMDIVSGGIEPQTRQTLTNIRATLARHGATMSDVVKCTLFLADMSQWAAVNAVYREFFPANALPARSALGASGLAAGARIEIECVAVVE